jgi:hypothetical protein
VCAHTPQLNRVLLSLPSALARTRLRGTQIKKQLDAGSLKLCDGAVVAVQVSQVVLSDAQHAQQHVPHRQSGRSTNTPSLLPLCLPACTPACACYNPHSPCTGQQNYTVNQVNSESVMMVCELTLLEQGDGKEATAAAAATDAGAGAKADQAATPAAKQQQQQQQQAPGQVTLQPPGGVGAAAGGGGGATKPLTPGPTPSPSEE